jgi:aspartyl-tRNA(Asn)/glutamyl-tRNA(Gln) amidotransferase subunit C
MTKISKDDIQNLADMSQISLNRDELEALSNDITQLISYLDMLKELDTENVKPTYNVGQLQNVWREDEVGNEIKTEELLQSAEYVVDNQIKVPKVL